MNRSPRFDWKSLLTGRALVVAALVVGLAVGLFAIERRVDSVLTQSLRSSAEQGASATAKTLADFALSERQLSKPSLGPNAKAAFIEQLRLSTSVESARLWARDGSLVIDTAFNHTDAEPSFGVEVAFDGQSITKLTSDAEELAEAGIDPGAAGEERGRHRGLSADLAGGRRAALCDRGVPQLRALDGSHRWRA